MRRDVIVLSLMLLGFKNAAASAAAVDSHALFLQAQNSVSQVMPDAFLVIVEGKKTGVDQCSGMIDWTFDFLGDQDDQGVPHSGAYVRVSPQATCAYAESVTVDPSLVTSLIGYYFLANNGNMDKVTLEWDKALSNVLASHPTFQWAGSFTLYSPLHPDWYKRVLYLFRGQGGDYLVDATTGEVLDPQTIPPSSKGVANPAWWALLSGGWSGPGSLHEMDDDTDCTSELGDTLSEMSMTVSLAVDCGSTFHFKQTKNYDLRPDTSAQGRKGLVLWGPRPGGGEQEWGYLAGNGEVPRFSLNFLSDDQQTLYYLESQIQGIADGHLDLRFEAIPPPPSHVVQEITSDLTRVFKR